MRGVRFRVWAPEVSSLSLQLSRGSRQLCRCIRDGEDFELVVPDAAAGRYLFVPL